MKFRDLKKDQIVRIPLVINSSITNPDQVLPPAVEILSTPQPCRNTLCAAWDVEVRIVDTGEERPYHRKPDFEVILITPAVPAEEAGN